MAQTLAPRHEARALTLKVASTAPIRLTVVIVNYNDWDRTGRLVDQLGQSMAVQHGQAEIVVVDNFSEPHRQIARLRRCPGVSLRRWRRNQGFGVAANEGVRLGLGSWSLVLNPDVCVSESFIDRVLHRIDEIEKSNEPTDPIGIVGFRVLNNDLTPQWSTGPFPTLPRIIVGQFLPRARRKYQPLRTNRPRQVPWVTGCCMLIRRDCFRAVGGFNSGFFLYYEDVDLCRRVRNAGWSVWYDPSARVIHEQPLHLREVKPRTRLMVRHGLLAYASAHWPAWQTTVLRWIMYGEANLRGQIARRSGNPDATVCWDELRRMLSVFVNQGTASARKRLMRFLEQPGALSSTQ